MTWAAAEFAGDPAAEAERGRIARNALAIEDAADTELKGAKGDVRSVMEEIRQYREAHEPGLRQLAATAAARR